jgi:hypothetical protein
VGSSSHPLESAPDGESEEMILKPTTLAWNFTLLDPIDQAEMLAEIADLFQRPECLDMFYYLADRKGLLFPEEERGGSIWKTRMPVVRFENPFLAQEERA